MITYKFSIINNIHNRTNVTTYGLTDLYSDNKIMKPSEEMMQIE